LTPLVAAATPAAIAAAAAVLAAWLLAALCCCCCCRRWCACRALWWGVWRGDLPMASGSSLSVDEASHLAGHTDTQQDTQPHTLQKPQTVSTQGNGLPCLQSLLAFNFFACTKEKKP
jgi:hypothetical protein